MELVALDKEPGDARDGLAPTVAAVASMFEEGTKRIARGLGISFTKGGHPPLRQVQRSVLQPRASLP